MKTPTQKEKIKVYEQFLHSINMCMTSGDNAALNKLIANADNWSYAYRIGNGERSDKEQQKIINKTFWNLCKITYERNNS